jgi:hypothetical protein
MIPADHFFDNGDGTAWLVDAETETSTTRIDLYRHLDRPCDGCSDHWGEDDDEWDPSRCPDCSGTGRHTFTVEVEYEVVDSWTTTGPNNTAAKHWDGKFKKEPHVLRVSVVPGMVLEIVNGLNDLPERSCIWTSSEGTFWLMHEGEASIITLPPAAAPGMWAVKLAVQS